jgi:prepilin-type N-terminal cleavage/methylation domain-containing protein
VGARPFSPTRHPSVFTPDASDERGFTLTEVLIAAAILATIAVMVSASFSSTFRLMEAIESQGDLDHQARVCLNLIAHDLLAGQPPAAMWIGRNGSEAGTPSDVLAFVTATHVASAPDAPESDLTRVTYAREGSRLMRYAARSLYTTSLDAIDREEVAEGVAGFNVRYYNGPAGLWLDDWDSTLKKLPKALLIELTLVSANHVQRSYTEWVSIPLQS